MARVGLLKDSVCLTANLAIENLLDLHYRYFASGMSASGRSVNLSLAYQF